MRENPAELNLSLRDEEWAFDYANHDRVIVRAVVFDDEGWFYFAQISRDDEFGTMVQVETSGGGVEPGEELETAIRRELREELGAEVEVLFKIGIVNDYYNLIHRHNINHYFLCRAVSFGETHLTQDEQETFHLSMLKLRYEEAVSEYEKCTETKLGRLIANRELPVLRAAKRLMDGFAER